MNWKKPQPPLDDEQRISRVTRAIQGDSAIAEYVPKRIPVPAQPIAPPTQPGASYQDVLEQVRAVSVKAIDTYGNRVIDEVQAIVQEHLEVSLKLAARAQELSDHYHSEMSALRKDTHDFTANARRDLEKLAGLASSTNAVPITEAVARIVDEQLNGTPEDVYSHRERASALRAQEMDDLPKRTEP